MTTQIRQESLSSRTQTHVVEHDLPVSLDKKRSLMIAAVVASSRRAQTQSIQTTAKRNFAVMKIAKVTSVQRYTSLSAASEEMAVSKHSPAAAKPVRIHEWIPIPTGTACPIQERITMGFTVRWIAQSKNKFTYRN